MGTLTPLLEFRNRDATVDINRRIASLADRGVFTGGSVFVVPGLLALDVGSFAAIGADGMTTIHDVGSGLTRVGMTAGVTQRVFLRAKYSASGPATLSIEVLDEASYLADPDVAVLMTICSVTLGGGATDVTSGDISFRDAHVIDPISRGLLRGTVATFASLPPDDTAANKVNRVGDIYLVLDVRQLYHWTGSAWLSITDTVVESNLATHRANGFSDEKHLTDDQKFAVDNTLSTESLGITIPGFSPEVNKVVDSATKIAIPAREEHNGLAAVNQVSLSGSYYIGKGKTGSANRYFKLLGRDPQFAISSLPVRGTNGAISNVNTTDGTFDFTEVASGVGTNTRLGDTVVLYEPGGTVRVCNVQKRITADSVGLVSTLDGLAAIGSGVVWQVRGAVTGPTPIQETNIPTVTELTGYLEIEGIFDAGGVTELDPSTDSDADGYFTNPVVKFVVVGRDSGDPTTFSGDLVVSVFKKGNFATMPVDMVASLPLFSEPYARQIKINKLTFGEARNVQDALDILDSLTGGSIFVKRVGDTMTGDLLSSPASNLGSAALPWSIGYFTNLAGPTGSAITALSDILPSGSLDLGSVASPWIETHTINLFVTGTVGGSLLPSLSNTWDLGSAVLFWRDVWCNDVNLADRLFGADLGIVSMDLANIHYVQKLFAVIRDLSAAPVASTVAFTAGFGCWHPTPSALGTGIFTPAFQFRYGSTAAHTLTENWLLRAYTGNASQIAGIDLSLFDPDLGTSGTPATAGRQVLLRGDPAIAIEACRLAVIGGIRIVPNATSFDYGWSLISGTKSVSPTRRMIMTGADFQQDFSSTASLAGVPGVPAWVASTSAPTIDNLFATLRLPDGALITGITVRYEQNHASNTVEFELFSIDRATGAVQTVLSSLTSPATTGTWLTMAPTPPVARLDYSLNIYFIKITMDMSVALLPQELKAVEFEYNQQDLLPS